MGRHQIQKLKPLMEIVLIDILLSLKDVGIKYTNPAHTGAISPQATIACQVVEQEKTGRGLLASTRPEAGRPLEESSSHDQISHPTSGESRRWYDRE
jgi:hypothetical protein